MTFERLGDLPRVGATASCSSSHPHIILPFLFFTIPILRLGLLKYRPKRKEDTDYNSPGLKPQFATLVFQKYSVNEVRVL